MSARRSTSSSRWPPPAASARGWRSTRWSTWARCSRPHSSASRSARCGSVRWPRRRCTSCSRPSSSAWHLDQWISDAWPGPVSLFVALTIVVYLHVVFGEMIPKNLAIAGPTAPALLLVPAARLRLAGAARPWSGSWTGSPRRWSGVFGVEPKDEITSRRSPPRRSRTSSTRATHEGLLEEERRRPGPLGARVQRQGRRRRRGPASTSWSPSRSARRPADIERLVARHGFSRFPVRDGRRGARRATSTSRTSSTPTTSGRPSRCPLKRVRRLATVQPDDEVETCWGRCSTPARTWRGSSTRPATVDGVVFLEDVSRSSSARSPTRPSADGVRAGAGDAGNRP